jgi:ABC-type multidrug transport system fused ATPase/permease subunit
MRAFAVREARPPSPEPVRPVKPFTALADLIGLVLRSKAPGLRWRLTASLSLTLAGKVAGVLAPLLLGAAVNRLTEGQGAAMQVSATFAALALGWAGIRLLSAAAPQLRDAIFTPVAQAAQARAASETFAHALSLSIDYHQTKRTGSLSRVIDRGARSMDFLLRALVFNLGPTLIELIIAAVVLGAAYDWRFALTAVVTVLVYVVVTFVISDWRIAHRRALNEADSEAAGRAVDALINYETVKAFGAEGRAVDDYARALALYGQAQVTATNSLTLLNVGQSAIMSVGLAVMAVMAGFEAAAAGLARGTSPPPS